MIGGVALILGLGVCLTLCLRHMLGTAAQDSPAQQAHEPAWIAKLEECLPQTQCGECGFDGCRPYAEAIAAGNARINRCPPGGQATQQNLSRLTGLPVLPIRKQDGSLAPPPAASIAHIDESNCIGCVKCIRACPVDAIIGAAKQMHGILPKDCTGCGLCLPPCPTNCITLVPATRALP